jgi:hypothetical protein
MFSNTAPGLPAYAQPPEVLQEVLNESLNFFYVNIGLAQLGLNPVPRCGPQLILHMHWRTNNL